MDAESSRLAFLLANMGVNGTKHAYRNGEIGLWDLLGWCAHISISCGLTSVRFGKLLERRQNLHKHHVFQHTHAFHKYFYSISPSSTLESQLLPSLHCVEHTPSLSHLEPTQSPTFLHRPSSPIQLPGQAKTQPHLHGPH